MGVVILQVKITYCFSYPPLSCWQRGHLCPQGRVLREPPALVRPFWKFFSHAGYHRLTLAQPKRAAHYHHALKASLRLVDSYSEIFQIRSQRFTKSPEWGTMKMNYGVF